MNELKLVFVKPNQFEVFGLEKYEYELFFSTTPDIVWGIDWDINKPNTVSLMDIIPDSTTYNKIYKLITIFPLKTIENTGCYSMEYAIERIIALSWIDIENLEEYPENGRLVFYFGETIDEINEKLKKYDYSLEEIK